MSVFASRRWHVAGIVLAAAALRASGHARAEEPSPIAKALAQEARLEFEDQPLLEVCDFIKKKHGIEIQIDNEVLTDNGHHTWTVNCSLNGLTLDAALKSILREFGLDYILVDDVLMITSRDTARQRAAAARASAPYPRPSEAKIEAALGEKTEFSFTDQPLEDVVDYFMAKHDIAIQFDKQALAEAGTFTSCGWPRGCHSTPGFLDSPTNSFFFVSTETTGCCRF